MAQKWVYFFGNRKAEGHAKMKELLGGKGANLAEMTNIGVPVPPGFTITTGVCLYYYSHKSQYPLNLKKQVREGLSHIETVMDRTFGDPAHPLNIGYSASN